MSQRSNNTKLLQHARSDTSLLRSQKHNSIAQSSNKKYIVSNHSISSLIFFSRGINKNTCGKQEKKKRETKKVEYEMFFSNI